MNITKIINENIELKELSKTHYLCVYITIQILYEKGYLKDVDKV